jgi:hypothetical protein
MTRYQVINTLDLKEVEQEIDTLISIAGDNPSDATIKEVALLMGVARSLGSSRSW